MAVLIEAISVVVRMDAIVERYPGAWEGFRRDVPNRTLCADDCLARIGFMTPPDVKKYYESLNRKGLSGPAGGKRHDFVVVDQQRGFTTDCDWAEFGSINFAGGKVSACRLVGDTDTVLATPDGWSFEESLSRKYGFVPSEEVHEQLEFLRRESGCDVYRDRDTGREVFVGRSKGG